MMDNDSEDISKDWQTTCTVLMLCATGAVIYGTLPALIRVSGSNEFGLRNLLYIVIWLYGLLGVTLCYIEDAILKKPLAIISFTWTAISLLWSLVRDVISSHETTATYPFNSDGNVLFLLSCFAIWICLFIYSGKPIRQADSKTRTTRWVAHFLVAVWACAPFFIVALIKTR